ncbi:M24 family metallopeptidase [Desmospora activa]|uniref:Xaa-Pro aminopeptidase n=1 Tax=Desmospora activa DSM 45169 TaxID=1121389 RepID=A0A2T4Z9I0_9BACL|nr:Xaa-Pro peptidase family protein [Desmospora activa]PTM58554.1 Xaa-Pro aminopeptidase [Desmospora activa DSM 45169]
MNTRLDNLIRRLNQESVDAAFFTSPSTIYYLTGFHCHPHERLLALGLVPGAEPFLVCPSLERSRAEQAGWTADILTYSDAEDPWSKVKKAYQDRLNQDAIRLAVEKSQLPLARAEALQALFSTVTFIDGEAIINEHRAIKDDDEIAILERAAVLADFGVEAGVSVLQEGITEMEVVAHLEAELKKKGIHEMAFSTMVLFGEKTGEPHGKPGSRTLKRGDLVLFDLGVVLEGYCSDITRTVAFQTVDDELQRIYQTVQHAQTAALQQCRPGIPMREVDIAARTIIDEAGYGEYFSHRVGHGLGLDAHEFPSIHDQNENILKEGMVFTVEPGIYVPGKGGVRIEDDVLITADGCKILTQYPKDWRVVT